MLGIPFLRELNVGAMVNIFRSRTTSASNAATFIATNEVS